MRSLSDKILTSLLCGVILCGCDQNQADSSPAVRHDTSDFVMYTFNDAFYFSFGENDELILDEREKTGLNCAFLEKYFKESDDYWYSITSEEAAMELKVIQINKDTLELKVSDTFSGGGFASDGVFHNTFIHDFSTYGHYDLIQHDDEFHLVRQIRFGHGSEMIIVLDICEAGDNIYVLLGDESKHQWIQVLDSELNETAVYTKPDEYATMLRMASDGTKIWITETNTRNEGEEVLSPAYRIISYNPENGEFGEETITLTDGYPYLLRYNQEQNSLLITHEPWSMNDAIWTICDLDTGEQEVFRCSDLAYEYAQMYPSPFAAAGSDGSYYFYAEGSLYKVRINEGVVKKWDLSEYTDLYPHTIIIRQDQTGREQDN